MLKDITWTDFIIGVIALSAIYYAIILFLYYKQDASKFISNKRKPAEAEGIPEMPKKPQRDDLEDLEILVNTIRTDILEKAGEAATKKELLNQISSAVANYNGLQNPAYQYALNNYLIQHSKIICGVEITEDDLEALWRNLPR